MAHLARIIHKFSENHNQLSNLSQKTLFRCNTGKPRIYADCSDFTSDSGQMSSRPWRFGSLAASAFLLPRG